MEYNVSWPFDPKWLTDFMFYKSFGENENIKYYGVTVDEKWNGFEIKFEEGHLIWTGYFLDDWKHGIFTEYDIKEDKMKAEVFFKGNKDAIC